MATIYTGINDPIDTFTARGYADGVVIYEGQILNDVFVPPHELRACLKFQWYHSIFPGAEGIAIDGEITEDYTVDVTSVANSGDYYCVITLGSGDDERCNLESDRRTVAIIDCEDQSTINFAGAGGNGSRTVSVIFPSFLRFEVDVISPDWITHTDITCAVLPDGVCDEISTLTAESVTANGRANLARVGFVDVNIGEFNCAYPVVQDYIRNQMGVGTPVVPAAGPTITSLEAGETVIVLGNFVEITAVAQLFLAGGGLGDASVITWTASNGGVDIPIDPPTMDPDTGGSLLIVTLDNLPLGEHTIIFTATANGISVSDPFFVNVVKDFSCGENGVVTGEFLGAVICHDILGNSLGHSFTDRFRVEAGTAVMVFSAGTGGFFPRPNKANDPTNFLFSISGPGIINGSFSREVAVSGFITITGEEFAIREDGYLTIGEYTASIAVLNCPTPNSQTDSPSANYYAFGNLNLNGTGELSCEIINLSPTSGPAETVYSFVFRVTANACAVANASIDVTPLGGGTRVSGQENGPVTLNVGVTDFPMSFRTNPGTLPGEVVTIRGIAVGGSPEIARISDDVFFTTT